MTSGPLLILGGTGEGKQLVQRLVTAGVPVIYSVAGRVRIPVLPCEVIAGGFTQYGGLSAYLLAQKVMGVVDATHPYARQISATAQRSTQEVGLPLWVCQRPPWQPQPGDQWLTFREWSQCLSRLAAYHRVLFTVGQLPPAVLTHCEALGRHSGQQQWLRTAVKPDDPLPGCMHWIQSIGPFDLTGERALMAEHGIDVLVSKNSGGNATDAKIQAARERGIPVLMLARPHFDSGSGIGAVSLHTDRWVHASVEACVHSILQKRIERERL